MTDPTDSHLPAGTAERPLLVIDMVLDPVCPWCYVGKRALDRAIMALSFNYTLVVRYRPFMLTPDVPLGGLDRELRLSKIYPTADKRAAARTALLQGAKEATLDLDPDTPKRIPHTGDALRLIRWAHETNQQSDLVEALLAAYWQGGADLSDCDTLATIAGTAGLDKAAIRTRLAGSDDLEEVLNEAKSFRKGGVNGVPTFIVNEAQGFAGALPPDQLLTALRQLAAESPVISDT